MGALRVVVMDFFGAVDGVGSVSSWVWVVLWGEGLVWGLVEGLYCSGGVLGERVVGVRGDWWVVRGLNCGHGDYPGGYDGKDDAFCLSLKSMNKKQLQKSKVDTLQPTAVECRKMDILAFFSRIRMKNIHLGSH